MMLSEALRIAGKVPKANVTLAPQNGAVGVEARLATLQWRTLVEGRITKPAVVPVPLAIAALLDGARPSLKVRKGQLLFEGAQLMIPAVKEPPEALSFDDAQEYALPENWLPRLKRVAVAADPGGYQPVLAAVQYNPDTDTLTAADGFRLRISGPPGDGGCLIPRDMIRLLPECPTGLRVAPPNVAVSDGKTTVASLAALGEYPEVTQLLFTPSWNFTCDSAELRAAVTSLLPLASMGSGIVRIEAIQGRIRLRVQAEDIGMAERHIAATISASPRIALSVIYLRDALKGMGSEFRLGGRSVTDPVAVEEPGWLEEIMPMYVAW